MKNGILIAILAIVLSSCWDDKIEPSLELTNGFNIQIGGELVLNSKNIEYYDHSAHLIYLKEGVSLNLYDFKNSKYWVKCGDDCIYEGTVCPNSDTIFSRTFDLCSSRYSSNILSIGYNDPSWGKDIDRYDPREDKRIIAALKADGLYHSGLTCTVDTIIRNSSKNLVLKLKLVNTDSFDYFYFDPDKMSAQEFRYFNNGLSLYNWDPFYFACYSDNITVVAPEMSPCCWGEDWVSLIKSGETKILTVTYDNFTEFPAGTYTAVFRFQGEMIKPVSGSTIFDKGKMWLGDIQIAQKIWIR